MQVAWPCLFSSHLQGVLLWETVLMEIECHHQLRSGPRKGYGNFCAHSLPAVTSLSTPVILTGSFLLWASTPE